MGRTHRRNGNGGARRSASDQPRHEAEEREPERDRSPKKVRERLVTIIRWGAAVHRAAQLLARLSP